MLYGKGKYQYELLDGWAKCPEGFSFLDVPGLSIDSQDRVYVLSRSGNPIGLFSREGELLNWFGREYFTRAHGICVASDGTIYCTDDGNHTVSQFTTDGKLLRALGNKDQPSDTGYTTKPSFYESLATIKKGGQPFNRPTGVALSSLGELYISDGYGNARVHKFSPDGTLILSWGEPGNAPGQFRLTHSVLVDKYDRVWVADRENNRLQIFNSEGKFLKQWTDLNRPCDVAIDEEDIVYISELNRRVSIFTLDGELLARWGSEGEDKDKTLFLAPHGIAVDSLGDIYIGEICMGIAGVDRGSRTVQKFVRKS